MENVSLYNKINLLPDDLRKEVEVFVESLHSKINTESHKRTRAFESLKGQIKMTTDFDDPIEDFKDYM